MGTKADPELGRLAEVLVACWLEGQGYTILKHRWHCRWGELDLIAQSRDRSLTFVEVKARSRRNWDTHGLLAITPQKQTKLWQTAELFLAQEPDLVEQPCRFDVALVHAQRSIAPPHLVDQRSPAPTVVQIGQAIAMGYYRLTLHQYIQDAFDAS